MSAFHDARQDFLRWAKGKPDWSGSSSSAKDWAWRSWQACFGRMSRPESADARGKAVAVCRGCGAWLLQADVQGYGDGESCHVVPVQVGHDEWEPEPCGPIAFLSDAHPGSAA